jgi:hypothetical protein
MTYKKMDYTNPVTGYTYPQLWWRPVVVTLNLLNVTASIAVRGYVDQAYADADKGQGGHCAGRSFDLGGDAYYVILGATLTLPPVIKDSLMAILWYGLENNPESVAFFTGAVDV